MLFLSDAAIDAIDKLYDDLEKDDADRERILKQILELDPHSSFTLSRLSEIKRNSGDRAGAEELLWRATEALPADHLPYLQLSTLLSGQSALSMGLAELFYRKLLRHQEEMEILPPLPDFEGEDFPDLEGQTNEEKFQLIADWIRLQREFEPLAVTARLRPYRLIEQLESVGDPSPGMIDALVQEGTAVLPVLFGVLRGWVREIYLEDDFIVQNALAILGEIGDPAAIPYLLDLVTWDGAYVSGPSDWALDRIVAQHPEDAARVLIELAPGLTGGQRISVTERIARNRNLDPKGVLLERLFEKIDRVEKAERNYLFQMLLSVGLMFRGRAMLEPARSLMRRYGHLLSRQTRRECDDLLETVASQGNPPVLPDPEFSQWTVYQICSGEVDWEEEEKSEEDEEEDFDEEADDEYIPEPIQKKSTPGRNDPCWCGSGKKYKKCHLEADEKQDRKSREPEGSRLVGQKSAQEFDDLRRQIGSLVKEFPKSEMKAAAAEFFGDDRYEDNDASLLLVDWIVHDRVSETFQQTPLEEYLHHHDSALTDRQRLFIESSIKSYVDLFEVQEINEGSGLEVKSLTSGKTVCVHDVKVSKTAVLWEGLFARTIEAERGTEFTGVALSVGRSSLETLHQWMEQDRRNTGLSWPVYLKRNWPRIRARNYEIAQEWLDNLELQNTKGEEWVFCKARYKVLDRSALLAALRSALDISETEDDASFVWLDSGNSALGHLQLSGADLTLECNSREGLKRGKKMLDGLAGSAVRFRSEEFDSTDDLKRQVREDPHPPKSTPRESSVPPEVERQIIGQAMEDHYIKWLDMKLPALEGKTPRQAAKNSHGRRKVAELLKQIENGEARKRKAGEYAYDVRRLRAELGIKA